VFGVVLGVVLVPWAAVNMGVVERSRSSLRIWSGGVDGGYAELLGRFGCEVYRYGVSVGGRRYGRFLIVVRGRLYDEAVSVLRNTRKLRRLAWSNFNLLVEAFKCFSPRGVDGFEYRSRLWKLLGFRLTKRLLDVLRSQLRSRSLFYRTPTRLWLRELFHRDMRGYGFKKRLYGCVKGVLEFSDGRIDRWRAREMCLESLLR